MAAQGNSTTVANMEAQRDVRTDDGGDVIMESEQSRHSGVSLQAGDSCVTQRSTTDSLIQLLTLKEASRENEPDFLQGNSEVTIDYIASRYVHTDILQDAIEVLEDKGVVILCGPPGSGKSYHGQALLRHYRSLSYKPHMLFTFKHWHKHVGEGRKCILLMDMTFGKECVKREEHHIWDSIRSTAIALISQGHCKLVVTVYPHVLRELLQLEDDIHSPLSHSVTVSLFESLDEDKKAEVLVAHLKELHVPPDTHPQVVANVLRKDLSGPVFGWCCNWLVLNWTSVQDPTVIFTQPAEAYVPLLRRMLLHPIMGNALAAVLSLVMLRHVRYLHQPQSVKEALLQLGFEPISDDRLAAVADLLKGFVLNQDADDFASRDLYDAAGLALCRSYRLPPLLTACDIIFLVKHVRTVTTAFVLSATVKSKEDTRLLVDKLLLHILKGQAPMICQHPDFGNEKFFNLFKACCEEKNELDKAMSVTDGQYHLPLIYWSIWNPSPRLACWCFRFFTENAKGSAELLLSTAVAALLIHQSADGRSWVEEFVKTLTLARKNKGKTYVKLPFPNIIATEETQKVLEDFRTILLTRGICYLGNASMPLPANLLSVRLSEQDGVVVDMSMKHVRLVLRLLTDCDVDDTDGDGNTLLHLAAAAGNLEVITIAVKSGASITLKNKAGLSPYDMGHKRRQWLKTSLKHDSIETLRKSCKDNDTETVKAFLCYTVSVDKCTFVLDPIPIDNFTVYLPPFHEACKAGAFDVTSLLIELGADVHSRNYDGQTALHYACQSKCSEIVKLLLEKGAEVNATDYTRRTAFHYACEYGVVDIVKHFLERGAEVIPSDCFRRTALHYACKSEVVDIVKLVLERGADIDATDTFMDTALHIASMYDNTDIIKLLLAKGSDINKKNNDGSTPLHIACQFGKIQTASLLISHGADVNAQNYNENDALHIACQYGKTECASLLISHGADLSMKNTNGDTLLHYASKSGCVETVKLVLDRGVDVNAQNNDGNGALHIACQCEKPECALLLISHGADVSMKNKNGDTLLHYASEDGCVETAKLVLDRGVDVNAQNNDGNGALHIACQCEETECALLLISHGADVSMKNKNGNTPFHLASESGYVETVQLVLDKGGDIHAKNNQGDTPLHSASYRGNHTTMRVLLQHGSDANETNNNGATSLHLAFSKYLIDVCKEVEETVLVLLENGANVNTRDKNGNTALHTSFNKGNWEHWFTKSAVLALLNHGAEVNIQNADGNTPLHLACEAYQPSFCDMLDAIQSLLEHGADPSVKNARGLSPIDLASEGGWRAHDLLNVLLQAQRTNHT